MNISHQSSGLNTDSQLHLGLFLTLWGQRYCRRYQLTFFLISAKETQNTLLILILHISV